MVKLKANLIASILVLGAFVASPAQAKPLEHLESWYDFIFHDSKVGFLHAVDEPTTFEGQPAIHAMRRSVVTVKRQDHVIRMESHTDAWCAPDGTPFRFKHVRIEGGARRVIDGVRVGSVLQIKMDVGGTLSEQKLRVEKGVYLASTLDALFKNELHKGRPIEGRAVVEEEGVIQGFKMVVRGDKKVDGKSVTILESTMGGLTSVEEVAANGQTLRTQVERLGARFELTTRAKALEVVDPTDIFTASRLSSFAALPAGDKIDELVVRLIGKSGRAPKPIADARQRVAGKTKSQVELRIRSDMPPKSSPHLPLKSLKKDLKAFLGSTPYESLGDERLITAAKEVVGDAKDLWTAARRINAFVHRHIENKSLAQAFSTANEALASREGDCTEHAVLFSALAKIAGIPTRLVTGLVYVGGSDGGFGYHEWVEIWTGKTWLAMDPTFGQDIADPTHIKFTQGRSDPEGLREAGVVAAELFGDLNLEVVSYQTADGRRVKL